IQTINVTLFGVDNGSGPSNSVIPMSVLIGDTGGNGAVTASDVSQTKAQSGQTAGASNFREDVNVSGAVSAADVSLVKSKAGTTLP
ncbi:MAG: dockerin type I domain-containing protein, partial [Verrucomicrobiota bacterium]